MKIRCLIIALSFLIISACGNPYKPGNIALSKDNSSKTAQNAATIPKSKTPSGFEGTYERVPMGDETGACPMTVIIDRDGSGYNYRLTLNTQRYNGKATLSKEGDETLITLEDIRWSEYEGDISRDDSDNAQNNADTLEVPVGVGALVTDSGLVIQNTGNSMNYYVKFAGCDCKYINLVKRKKR
ncbi:hypothetical protein LT679_16105 [Mucilaginibacter roseus]|uniref:Lipoprotein n=1 Tax=Mucilaginibacter roseus TaxID=1528868 RepID=A0ABS8U4U8_9SPHI|nr:hypothetical protein [Mucilaginibacter roseus]MCD8742135.1 hypothetical protein [Mucilaginibacter roseus]